MAVKYTTNFYDDANILWRTEIDLPQYIGDPIEIRGVGRTFSAISYGQSNEDLFEPIVGSGITLSYYNQGEVDIKELQLLRDLQGRVRVYRNGNLYWSGFLLADGIQRTAQPTPYVFTINATDGLTMLDGVDFNGVTNWNLPTGIDNRSPLAFVRYVLFSSQNLGNPLPIRWTSSVVYDTDGKDGFAGTRKWSAFGEGFVDFNGNRKSCMYVLRGLLSAFQMRIYQVGGKWTIERLNDIVTGNYTWKEIDDSYTNIPPVLTSGSNNANISPDEISSWVGINPFCVLDDVGFTTGEQGFSDLLNEDTMEQKPNIPDTPDYIFPSFNIDSCPVPDEEVTIFNVYNDLGGGVGAGFNIIASGQTNRIRLIDNPSGESRDSLTSSAVSKSVTSNLGSFSKSITYYGVRNQVTEITGNGGDDQIDSIYINMFSNIEKLILPLSPLNGQINITGCYVLLTVDIRSVQSVAVVNSLLTQLDANGNIGGTLIYAPNNSIGVLPTNSISYNSLVQKLWTITGRQPV